MYEGLNLGLYGPEKISLIDDSKQVSDTFLAMLVGEWLDSPERKTMIEGNAYLRNRNTKIAQKERTLVGEGGLNIRCPYLSNNKLSHAFMRKLTYQKLSFLLGKDFTVQTEDAKFTDILNEYFDKDFFSLLKTVGRDAITGGVGWLQVFYDPDGKLKFKYVPNREIFPLYADAAHKELEAVLRIYSIWKYNLDGRQEVVKVEYYTTQGIWLYQYDGKGLIPDPDVASSDSANANKTYNFRVKTQAKTLDGKTTDILKGAMWPKIPFIPFKYNPEEESLLSFIKPLIDEYDRARSDVADHMQDNPKAPKIVKGFEGENHAQFIRNFTSTGYLFVGDDGGVETLVSTVDVALESAHITQLRSDIYEFGSGVDTQNKELGVESGIALKYRYSDLELDAKIMGNEFLWSLDILLFFIKQDILIKQGLDYVDTQVTITYNTDMAINETEVITNLNNSPELSTETKLAMHPYVENVQLELERKKKEEAEQSYDLFDENASEGNSDGENDNTDKTPDENNA